MINFNKLSKKKVNKCKWGEKTYKTCFFAPLYPFYIRWGS